MKVAISEMKNHTLIYENYDIRFTISEMKITIEGNNRHNSHADVSLAKYHMK